MNYDVSIKLSDQDIFQLETEAAAIAAEEFRLFWAAQSKSPKKFYVRMSETVASEENNVIADGLDGGLAKWISDKRGIVDEFLQQSEMFSQGRVTVGKYNL